MRHTSLTTESAQFHHLADIQRRLPNIPVSRDLLGIVADEAIAEELKGS